MGIVTPSRRKFLQGSVALTGLGLLSGCGLPPLPWQQTPRVYRIGYLWNGAASPTFMSLRDAFLQGMRDLAYVEDQTFMLETRRANGDAGLPETVAELLGLRLDVIVAPAVVEAGAVQAASTTIPIVSAGVGDLVTTGLAESLARPGRNVTGLSTPVLARKQLEFLKEAVPTLTRVAVMIDQTRVTDFERESHDAAARSLGLELQILGVDGPDGLAAFFQAALGGGANGVLLTPVPLTSANQARIAELATLNRLPAIAQQSDAASLGQLMAYGPNRAVLHRSAATYVDKILKGTRPSDIPAEQPTVFDFGINLKTAQTLGLTIPPSVLAQATVIVQ